MAIAEKMQTVNSIKNGARRNENLQDYNFNCFLIMLEMTEVSDVCPGQEDVDRRMRYEGGVMGQVFFLTGL